MQENYRGLTLGYFFMIRRGQYMIHCFYLLFWFTFAQPPGVLLFHSTLQGFITNKRTHWSFAQSKVFKQFLADLGSLKCNPYVKHLFLWLFMKLQHKLCKRYLNIRDKMLNVHNRCVLWSWCRASYLKKKQIVP